MDAAAPIVPQRWAGQDLTELLTLTPRGADESGRPRFASRGSDLNLNRRLYGGQLLGQALWAAAQTAPPDRRASMLQATFLRGPAVDQPADYHVETLLDGARYSIRHVRMRQRLADTLDAQLTFQAPCESAMTHETPAADVPEPESLPEIRELILAERERSADVYVPLIDKPCVEMRPIDASRYLTVANDRPFIQYWLRVRSPLADTPGLHDAALAYLSDYFANFSGYSPYRPMVRMRELYVASLNHGIWFHQPFRADDWLLFESDSPSASQGRGFSVLRVYDRARRLVASVTQQFTLGERR